MLNLLGLVHVTPLHFKFFQSFDLLFKTFVLVGHHIQKDDNLFGFSLLLLQLLLSLFQVTSEAFSFSTMSVLKLDRVCNLVVLNLDQFPQILVLFLQGVRFGLHRISIRLRLKQPGLVWLVLLTQFRNLFLRLVHELIFGGHNRRNGLFAAHQLTALLFGDALVLGQLFLQFGRFLFEFLRDR